MWNLDGFNANILYLIPMITLIAFDTSESTTIHDNVILTELKWMDLINYIVHYHTGSEFMYPTSIKLNPTLETKLIMKYVDQRSFLNKKNPDIGFAIAVGMITNACILVVSYKDPEGKKLKSDAKLIKVCEIARSLNSMFNTMDKEATGKMLTLRQP